VFLFKRVKQQAVLLLEEKVPEADEVMIKKTIPQITQ